MPVRCPFGASAIALIGMLATTATAGTSAPGLNIRWDQCYGDGGAWNKQFACDTNTGSERMVLSFELASTRDDVAGIEFDIDVATEGPLPTWWHFMNSGTCRQSSITLVTAPPIGATNCTDWGQGNAIGGIGAYAMFVSGAPACSRWSPRSLSPRAPARPA